MLRSIGLLPFLDVSFLLLYASKCAFKRFSFKTFSRRWYQTPIRDGVTSSRIYSQHDIVCLRACSLSMQWWGLVSSDPMSFSLRVSEVCMNECGARCQFDDVLRGKCGTGAGMWVALTDIWWDRVNDSSSSVDWHRRSGRPRTARTNTWLDEVKDFALIFWIIVFSLSSLRVC